jgi:DNA-binding transcriptional LysR family regulator
MPCTVGRHARLDDCPPPGEHADSGACNAVNLRFVEAFHWAAKLGSVTRAAEKMHLTQSALSSRIATLEQELGVLLLDRRDKHFRLTLAGMRFLAHAQRLLELQRDVKRELGQRHAHPLTLRIGAIESVLHSWLIDWVRRMREESPELELALTVETTPVLTEQLGRGALDIAFAALPAAGEGVRSQTLEPMEMAFVGHADLHKRRRYALADLLPHDLLTFQRGSQPHVALLDLFRAARLQVHRVHTISSISAMVQLVEHGFGIATLPRAAVLRLAQRQPLKLLPCEAALAPLPIHASWRDDPSMPLTEQVVDSALMFAAASAGASPRRGHRKNR